MAGAGRPGRARAPDRAVATRHSPRAGGHRVRPCARPPAPAPMSELVPSDRAPGLHVAPDVIVPDDAEIAPHVTIHSGVSLGEGVSLQQGAIIGRPQWI